MGLKLTEMETLKRIKRALASVKALQKINQSSYVRDEHLKPVGVNWDLEKQSDFFVGLYNIAGELESAIESLEQL